MTLQISMNRVTIFALTVTFAACANSPSQDDSGDANEVDGAANTNQDGGSYGSNDATVADTGAAMDATFHPDAAHDAAHDATSDAPADSPFIPLDGPCGPGSCGWCCTPTGQCLAGPSDTQCGANGAACNDCTQSALACNTSTGVCMTPEPCGVDTCPNGCCAAGVCQTMEGDTQCGQGGALCTDCTQSGEVCTSRTCAPEGGVPDPDCFFACAGCCDANNFCFAVSTNIACGINGATCANCPATGATCIGGFCALPDGAVEDPDCVDDCPTGCCDSLGICHTPASSNTMCGTNGATCSDCTTNGATCIGGFCTLSDGAVEDLNCEEDCYGCCDLGHVCQPGTSRTQCGSDGDACQDCGSNLVCVAMTCQ